MNKQVFIHDRWETIHGGHTVFEINTETGTIEPAIYEKENHVKINENCLYVPCLTKKVAGEKYLNWLMERIKEEKPNNNDGEQEG